MGETLFSEPMVMVPQDRYLELMAAEAKLDALEAGGVDSWSFYDEAMESYRAERD